MSSTPIPAERRKLICELVCFQGVIKVADLSTRPGVPEITIRHDLEVLEEAGR